ncbi:hypothetical protein ACOBV8_18340 (plasmid) [Pseudoalteromonas espejiana]
MKKSPQPSVYNALLLLIRLKHQRQSSAINARNAGHIVLIHRRVNTQSHAQNKIETGNVAKKEFYG